jgi:glucose/arabinose dehydrogenase
LVGSASNDGEGIGKRDAAAIARWEAEHGLGSAWCNETDRAAVLVFDPAGKNRRVFASGLRNCVGLAVHPLTGDLWCSTNERDDLGDDLVPDFITRVRDGAFYGWPWYYIGANGQTSRLLRAQSARTPGRALSARKGQSQLLFNRAAGEDPDRARRLCTRQALHAAAHRRRRA